MNKKANSMTKTRPKQKKSIATRILTASLTVAMFATAVPLSPDTWKDGFIGGQLVADAYSAGAGNGGGSYTGAGPQTAFHGKGFGLRFYLVNKHGDLIREYKNTVLSYYGVTKTVSVFEGSDEEAEKYAKDWAKYDVMKNDKQAFLRINTKLKNAISSGAKTLSVGGEEKEVILFDDVKHLIDSQYTGIMSDFDGYQFNKDALISNIEGVMNLTTDDGKKCLAKDEALDKLTGDALGEWKQDTAGFSNLCNTSDPHGTISETPGSTVDEYVGFLELKKGLFVCNNPSNVSVSLGSTSGPHTLDVYANGSDGQASANEASVSSYYLLTRFPLDSHDNGLNSISNTLIQGNNMGMPLPTPEHFTGDQLKDWLIGASSTPIEGFSGLSTGDSSSDNVLGSNVFRVMQELFNASGSDAATGNVQSVFMFNGMPKGGANGGVDWGLTTGDDGKLHLDKVEGVSEGSASSLQAAHPPFDLIVEPLVNVPLRDDKDCCYYGRFAGTFTGWLRTLDAIADHSKKGVTSTGGRLSQWLVKLHCGEGYYTADNDAPDGITYDGGTIKTISSSSLSKEDGYNEAIFDGTAETGPYGLQIYWVSGNGYTGGTNPIEPTPPDSINSYAVDNPPSEAERPEMAHDENGNITGSTLSTWPYGGDPSKDSNKKTDTSKDDTDFTIVKIYADLYANTGEVKYVSETDANNNAIVDVKEDMIPQVYYDIRAKSGKNPADAPVRPSKTEEEDPVEWFNYKKACNDYYITPRYAGTNLEIPLYVMCDENLHMYPNTYTPTYDSYGRIKVDNAHVLKVNDPSPALTREYFSFKDTFLKSQITGKYYTGIENVKTEYMTNASRHVFITDEIDKTNISYGGGDGINGYTVLAWGTSDDVLTGAKATSSGSDPSKSVLSLNSFDSDGKGGFRLNVNLKALGIQADNVSAAEGTYAYDDTKIVSYGYGRLYEDYTRIGSLGNKKDVDYTTNNDPNMNQVEEKAERDPSQGRGGSLFIDNDQKCLYIIYVRQLPYIPTDGVTPTGGGDKKTSKGTDTGGGQRTPGSNSTPGRDKGTGKSTGGGDAFPNHNFNIVKVYGTVNPYTYDVTDDAVMVQSSNTYNVRISDEFGTSGTDRFDLDGGTSEYHLRAFSVTDSAPAAGVGVNPTNADGLGTMWLGGGALGDLVSSVKKNSNYKSFWLGHSQYSYPGVSGLEGVDKYSIEQKIVKDKALNAGATAGLKFKASMWADGWCSGKDMDGSVEEGNTWTDKMPEAYSDSSEYTTIGFVDGYDGLSWSDGTTNGTRSFKLGNKSSSGLTPVTSNGFFTFKGLTPDIPMTKINKFIGMDQAYAIKSTESQNFLNTFSGHSNPDNLVYVYTEDGYDKTIYFGDVVDKSKDNTLYLLYLKDDTVSYDLSTVIPESYITRSIDLSEHTVSVSGSVTGRGDTGQEDQALFLHRFALTSPGVSKLLANGDTPFIPKGDVDSVVGKTISNIGNYAADTGSLNGALVLPNESTGKKTFGINIDVIGVSGAIVKTPLDDEYYNKFKVTASEIAAMDHTDDAIEAPVVASVFLTDSMLSKIKVNKGADGKYHVSTAENKYIVDEDQVNSVFRHAGNGADGTWKTPRMLSYNGLILKMTFGRDNDPVTLPSWKYNMETHALRFVADGETSLAAPEDLLDDGVPGINATTLDKYKSKLSGRENGKIVDVNFTCTENNQVLGLAYTVYDNIDFDNNKYNVRSSSYDTLVYSGNNLMALNTSGVIDLLESAGYSLNCAESWDWAQAQKFDLDGEAYGKSTLSTLANMNVLMSSLPYDGLENNANTIDLNITDTKSLFSTFTQSAYFGSQRQLPINFGSRSLSTRRSLGYFRSEAVDSALNGGETDEEGRPIVNCHTGSGVEDLTFYTRWGAYSENAQQLRYNGHIVYSANRANHNLVIGASKLFADKVVVDGEFTDITTDLTRYLYTYTTIVNEDPTTGVKTYTYKVHKNDVSLKAELGSDINTSLLINSYAYAGLGQTPYYLANYGLNKPGDSNMLFGVRVPIDYNFATLDKVNGVAGGTKVLPTVTTACLTDNAKFLENSDTLSQYASITRQPYTEVSGSNSNIIGIRSSAVDYGQAVKFYPYYVMQYETSQHSNAFTGKADADKLLEFDSAGTDAIDSNGALPVLVAGSFGRAFVPDEYHEVKITDGTNTDALTLGGTVNVVNNYKSNKPEEIYTPGKIMITSSQWSSHAQVNQALGSPSCALPGGAMFGVSVDVRSRRYVTVTSYSPLLAGSGRTQVLATVDNAADSPLTNGTGGLAESPKDADGVKAHVNLIKSLVNNLKTMYIDMYTSGGPSGSGTSDQSAAERFVSENNRLYETGELISPYVIERIDAKYLLKQDKDGSGHNSNESDLDIGFVKSGHNAAFDGEDDREINFDTVDKESKVKYYTFYTTVDGRILVKVSDNLDESSTTTNSNFVDDYSQQQPYNNSNVYEVLGKGGTMQEDGLGYHEGAIGEAAYGAMTSDVMANVKKLEEHTGIVTKLTEAIERNHGYDPASRFKTNGEASGSVNWYNEAFDGITYEIRTTELVLGFVDPVERGAVLDPSLIPSQSSKGDMFTSYNSAQFATGECLPSASKNYDSSYTTIDGVESAIWGDITLKSADGDKQCFVGFDKTKMKQLFVSDIFFIPNATVQDLK